jgi:hypothetical protein
MTKEAEGVSPQAVVGGPQVTSWSMLSKHIVIRAAQNWHDLPVSSNTSTLNQPLAAL